MPQLTQLLSQNGIGVDSMDLLLLLATRGDIDGVKVMRSLGERDTIGTTASGEDVWRGNELTPAPTSHLVIPTPSSSGEQMTIVSESVNDTSGGTGARTIKIYYLDANGVEQTETLSMNGTTPVNTVATNIRFVNDMHVATVGAGGGCAGHVKIYKTGSAGLVYNMIALGGNKSLVPHRMVPAGKSLFIVGWDAGEAQNKRAAVRLRSTDMDGVLVNGVFCFKHNAYLKGGSTGEIKIFSKIPQLSIIKVSAWADVAGAEVSCHWYGLLIDN